MTKDCNNLHGPLLHIGGTTTCATVATVQRNLGVQT